MNQRNFEWDFTPGEFLDGRCDGVITKQLLIKKFIEIHHLDNCFVDLFHTTIYDGGRMECTFHVTDF